MICKHGHEMTPENSVIEFNGYTICRQCKIRRAMDYEKRHPEQTKARNRRSDHAYRLRNIYKITQEEYELMVAEQGGKCALPSCLNDLKDIDHDHSTGKVRGLLCHQHNLAIGQFDDDIQLIREAADYLEKDRT